MTRVIDAANGYVVCLWVYGHISVPTMIVSIVTLSFVGGIVVAGRNP